MCLAVAPLTRPLNLVFPCCRLVSWVPIWWHEPLPLYFDHIVICCSYVIISTVLVQVQSPKLGDSISYHILFAQEVSNQMSNCCSSKAQWSSTRLDIPVVKNGASGL